MTQEELDALMSGGIDDIDEKELEDIEQQQKEKKEEKKTETSNISEIQEKDYNIKEGKVWPPAPPTSDYKVVHQLDDVTKDSEEKATEIFDKLESLSTILMDIEDDISGVEKCLNNNLDIFKRLSTKFPEITIFKTAIEDIEKQQSKLDTIISSSQMGGDEVMMAMDVMQYQDIHRQKIERVINVMRTLAKYMNSLFESDVDDEKRVSSAVHIAGDTGTEDLTDESSLEDLINSFGKK